MVSVLSAMVLAAQAAAADPNPQATLATLNRDALEAILFAELQPEKEALPERLEQVRLAWMPYTVSGRMFQSEIVPAVGELRARVETLQGLMAEVGSVGSLVTTEFFGSTPKWVMSAHGVLETTHPFYSGHVDFSVWGRALEGRRPAREVGGVRLTHLGYEQQRVHYRMTLNMLNTHYER